MANVGQKSGDANTSDKTLPTGLGTKAGVMNGKFLIYQIYFRKPKNSVRTPENFAVITLKFEQRGFTME